eukprot:Em0012g860a
MGGLETKLVSLLQDRKLAEALELWLDNPKLREQIDPNGPMKWTGNKDGDTPLHCAARYGSKPILWLLLSKGGDPFVRNAKGETPMHIVCTSSKHDSASDAVQADLLEVLLSKIPEVTGEKTYEIISDMEQENDGDRLVSTFKYTCEDELNLGIVDKARNTPLHLAAASGLKGCVEVLLAHGAPLFAHNIAGQTPCEAAAQAKHEDIAKLLECKMVLMENSFPTAAEDVDKLERRNVFHNTDSLQLLQKEIVNRVALNLEIPEFPAEALLKGYGWSEDLVTEAWKEDMHAACEKAGLSKEVLGGCRRGTFVQSSHQCEICLENIHPVERVCASCDHNFCKQCMAKYLELQINEQGGKEIRCPSSGCYLVVPNDILVALLPESTYQRYTDLNIKQFVGSRKDMKWCPYPGCTYAIKLPTCTSDVEGVARVKEDSPDMGINVVCGRGHWVCWTCLQEAHEPCDCNLWRRWKEIISNVDLEADGAKCKATIESERWILGHTKPCPNCSIPIQKKEGCNQVTCKNCGHSFCWLCMDPWENHGHKTGGSFFCNRYKERAEVRQRLRQSNTLVMRRKSIEDMIQERKKSMENRAERNDTEDLTEERSRFMHYYNRYQNHLESIKIEQKLLEKSTVKSREMSQTYESFVAKRRTIRWCSDGHITTANMLPAHTNINFLEDAVLTLLRSRKVLSSSYAFGFFFSDSIGEQHHRVLADLQDNLEEAVETLSQMVNRPYLCIPHSIMAATARNVNSHCEKYLKSTRL